MTTTPKSSKRRDDFDRWKLGWERTWAYRLFKGHHTQLNSLYWAHAPALRYVFAATRGKKHEDPASSLLSLPLPDASRINITLGQWGKQFKDFDNWVRLNALVAITGYLEVYLKTVTRLALESDPTIPLGIKHGIDGVTALKNKPKYSSADQVVSCVKGTWHERLAHYKSLFGKVPTALNENIGSLERLRTIRNGVAHAFGRAPDEYETLADTSPKPFRRVTEERLKETLALVDEIALAVDRHLGTEHIGDYEALYFYHHWDKSYSSGHETEARALSQLIGHLHGRNKNLGYYQGLIDYYRAL